MKKTAFVLGNGRSRLNIDLARIKDFGKIYGCNALYREFEPDVLVAVDPQMIIEICETGYQLNHQVWTNTNSKFKKYQNLNFFKNPRGWSSGPTALYKACLDCNDEIYILGFDYHGIRNEMFNNVYADTNNYKTSHDTATYYGNWLRQTEMILTEYSYVNFYRVIDEKTKPVKEWDGMRNFQHITYDNLKNRLKGY